MRPQVSTARVVVFAATFACVVSAGADGWAQDRRSAARRSAGGQSRQTSDGGGSGDSVARTGTAVARPSGRASGGEASAPSTRSQTSAAPAERSDAAQAVAVRRGREDRPATGQAVSRPAGGPIHGGGAVIIGNPYYYPWGYGYNPWGYGGFGFGAYYGGWYGPWWHGGYGYPYYGGYQPSYSYAGGVRLKVQPSSAEVFVDGYYVGVVDEFDNPFQQLRLESGPHRIEVRQEGYEPLTFEVRIVPDHTITYRAELKKAP
jgi:hypothetical protein